MSINSYVVSMAVAMSQAKVEQAVNIAVMKKAMDVHEAQGLAIVEMMNSVPDAGRLLDIYA